MSKKILMLGPDPIKTTGGMSSVVKSYYESDLAKNNSLKYISTYEDGQKYKIFIQGLRKYLKALILEKVDVVHIHSASRGSFYRKSLIVLIGRLFFKKIVFHLHGAEFNEFYHQESAKIQKAWIRFSLKACQVIIVLSSQWKKDLSLIVGEKSNIVVIPNGVILPVIRNLDKDKKYISILTMGRLGKRKGIYDLLEAAKDIVKIYPHVRFTLAGDGEIQKVKEIIRKNKLEAYFDVPGWVLDGRSYFRKADIYLLPSYNEGLPISVLEAASYGIPVISTPVGGISDVIKDGISGYLVEPGDIGQINNRIKNLISDDDLRLKMGRESRNVVKEQFNLIHIIDQIDVLYSNLLEESQV